MVLSFKEAKAGNKSMLKTSEQLLSDLIPPEGKFLYREKQGNQFTSALVPLSDGERAMNIFVFGKKGTGKTALTLSKLQELKAYTEQENEEREKQVKIDYVYVNCGKTSNNNDSGIFVEILNKLDNKNYTKRGQTKSFGYEEFEKMLERKELDGLVIVLDEVEKLLEYSGDGLLYYLSRIKDNPQNPFKTNVNTIIISNNPRVKHGLMDSRTESSFGRYRVDFLNYDVDQLQGILRQRVDAVFKPGVVKEGVVELIAALEGQEMGDARRCIEILKNCYDIARQRQQGEITRDMVPDAVELMDNNLWVRQVKTLPKKQQVLFFGILELEINQPGELHSHRIYKKYNQVCDSIGYPHSDVRNIQNYLKELALDELIEKVNGYHKGLRRKTMWVKVMVPKNMLKRCYGILASDLGLELPDAQDENTTNSVEV